MRTRVRNALPSRSSWRLSAPLTYLLTYVYARAWLRARRAVSSAPCGHAGASAAAPRPVPALLLAPLASVLVSPLPAVLALRSAVVVSLASAEVARLSAVLALPSSRAKAKRLSLVSTTTLTKPAWLGLGLGLGLGFGLGSGFGLVR